MTLFPDSGCDVRLASQETLPPLPGDKQASPGNMRQTARNTSELLQISIN